MTDLRDLCARMADELDHYRQLLMDDRSEVHALAAEARAALAEPEPDDPTDEEIMGLMPQRMHEDLAAAARAMAGQSGTDSTRATGVMRIFLNRHSIDLARAVLARWGNRQEMLDSSPADGEVAELVAWMRNQVTVHEVAQTQWAKRFVRAASLLERLSPPQPIPLDERLPASERAQQIEELAADAVCGLRYIEQQHGRLYGVGWDRVYAKADRLLNANALPLPEEVV